MKKFSFIILVLALISILSFTVNAEHLPEENIIGNDLIVEKDSNIVKENIDADKITDDEGTDLPYKVIKMTKTTFFKAFTLPSVLLLVSAVILFTSIYFLERFRRPDKAKEVPEAMI